MRKHKIWRIHNADPVLEYIFRHELGVSPVLARLLVNRGVATVEEARRFLDGGLEDLHDPFSMADMEKAVGRILLALKRGEKILVYGDYDADGITATALLVKVFQSLGGQADYFVPHRMEEGYGLHLEALRRAGQKGYGLVVTVDCGISAAGEVACNKSENGPDIVITDHHEPPAEIPGAVAVVNPKRADCPYRFKELAGVGVALKLAQALLLRSGGEAGRWTRYLDLACLGTVADIVPLTGENRIIVKYGLSALAATTSPGITALMEVSGIKADSLGTREVGFALAPRLNAAGRVGDAGRAVRLFLTGDAAEASELAAVLDRGNQDRQRIESNVLVEAMGMLDAEPSLAEGRVIVLSSSGWHQGVVGIVASRLVDKYYKPVLMIALEGDQGKGSGRSIPGFHLFNAISSCSGLLIRFGGHAQAAGFSISADNIGHFRKALNDYARGVDDDVFVPGMELDATISFTDITDELVGEINKLAPFGHCNPGPMLACRGVRLVSCREIGKNGGHLKLTLKENGAFLDGIGFKLASCAGEIAAASEVDVAFLPSINHWRGRKSLQLEVKDIRASDSGREESSAGRPCAVLPEAYYIGHQNDIESLRRVGPLALLPEFLSGVLALYGEISPNFVFPGNYLDFFSSAVPVDEKQTPGRLRIINEYHSYKPGRLIELVTRRKSSLVLVNSPGRAVELAAFLSRSGVRAAFIHQGTPPDGGLVLKEMYESGGIGALVCTYGARCLLDITLGSAIFYDLPFSPAEAGKSLAGGFEGDVLLNGKDIATGIEFLYSMAPDRVILAEFYTYLRARGSGYIDWEQAAGHLRGCGLARAGLHTVAFGMAVFSDLGLLDCRSEKNGSRVMISAVNGKKDLCLSPVFRSGQEIRSSTCSWWESWEDKI